MGHFFNTAGPCRPDWHYMLPAAQRLPEVPWLVDKFGYFVVHAPRQTGKTTTLRAIASELTATGRYAALVASCQTAGAAGEDVAAAQQRLVSEIRSQARTVLSAELRPAEGAQDRVDPLRHELAEWVRVCPLPIVLFLDEIDSLTGRSLVTVLSQLRTGYNDRPEAFPASVGLCGLRDVRDGGGSGSGGMGAVKAASGGDPSRLLSASPFNIKLKSLRLGDFSAEEIGELYRQHTVETGQVFTDAGVEFAFELTRGQPWLVNALANEVVVEMGVPADEAIGPRRLEAAKERLIRARATHLDSLAAKLAEPRVRRVIEPILAGENGDTATREEVADEVAEDAGGFVDTYNDDASYVRDLGLIKQENPLRIANPIYREVIPRVLGARVEGRVTADPRSFVLADGRLDFSKLLEEFASFWKRDGEVLVRQQSYPEAAAQVVMMAFLHRVVNGGGYVDREYGVGRGRIDLCVRWPYQDVAGKRVFQQEGMELKVWRHGRPDPLAVGLRQLDGYLDRLGLDEGTLVVFDQRRTAESIEQRTTFETARSPAGREVTLLRA